MRKTRAYICFRALLIVITITCFEHCKEKTSIPKSDSKKEKPLPALSQLKVIYHAHAQKIFIEQHCRNCGCNSRL